jgi:hypothetical protein
MIIIRLGRRMIFGDDYWGCPDFAALAKSGKRVKNVVE